MVKLLTRWGEQCVDITFTDTDEDVAILSQENCFNSSNLGIREVRISEDSPSPYCTPSNPINGGGERESATPIPKEGMSTPAVVGIGTGIGAPLLIALLTTLFFFYRERKKTAALQRTLDAGGLGQDTHAATQGGVGRKRSTLFHKRSELAGNPISELEGDRQARGWTGFRST